MPLQGPIIGHPGEDIVAKIVFRGDPFPKVWWQIGDVIISKRSSRGRNGTRYKPSVEIISDLQQSVNVTREATLTVLHATEEDTGLLRAHVKVWDTSDTTETFLVIIRKCSTCMLDSTTVSCIN